ncbi:MAG: peptide deformylase [Firmicutes bacterium]|nr:peptide deformylase [Bacillota bacterium]
MGIRNVLIEGDETLRKKSREVTEITPRMLTLLDDMAETMYANDGVGLAAPQVGVLRRAIVIDIREETSGLIKLFNPVITEKKGSQKVEEACLSVPGMSARLERPFEVTVEGLNPEGEKVQYKAYGFLAQAFCHEIDHLDGILYVDHPHEIIEPEDKEGED